VEDINQAKESWEAAMSETKTPYQTAVDWYKEEEIHRSILSLQRGVDRSEKIPTNILSKEFAIWLTGQYRAAMSKGIHFGEQRAADQLTAAQARIAELEFANSELLKDAEAGQELMDTRDDEQQKELRRLHTRISELEKMLEISSKMCDEWRASFLRHHNSGPAAEGA
jgi:hypothetical protein